MDVKYGVFVLENLGADLAQRMVDFQRKLNQERNEMRAALDAAPPVAAEQAQAEPDESDIYLERRQGIQDGHQHEWYLVGVVLSIRHKAGAKAKQVNGNLRLEPRFNAPGERDTDLAVFVVRESSGRGLLMTHRGACQLGELCKRLDRLASKIRHQAGGHKRRSDGDFRALEHIASREELEQRLRDLTQLNYFTRVYTEAPEGSLWLPDGLGAEQVQRVRVEVKVKAAGSDLLPSLPQLLEDARSMVRVKGSRSDGEDDGFYLSEEKVRSKPTFPEPVEVETFFARSEFAPATELAESHWVRVLIRWIEGREGAGFRRGISEA